MVTEILLMLGLGLLLLGPKHLQSVLGHVAQVRAEWEKAKRSFRTELAAEAEAAHSASKPDRLSASATIESQPEALSPSPDRSASY